MDIRNWPLGRIMQLPDECFGRRWPIITSREIAMGATDEWLVKPALPERCVLWDFAMQQCGVAAGIHWFKVALGDNEPASDAAFDAFERLWPGDFENTVEEGGMFFMYPPRLVIPSRMPIVSMGRTFAVQVHNGNGVENLYVNIVFVVSSIPTEVPDCLLSGPGRSL